MKSSTFFMHLKGVEPSHTAPEAVALSIELQVHNG